MIMLPAFKLVAEQMGKPPICIVSKDYASILDGVSYVRPWVVPLHWWKGVGQARELAQRQGFNPIVAKWWDDPKAKPPMVPEPSKAIQLMVHGKPRTVSAKEWDSYQLAQWRFSGFNVEKMMREPLTFDRRNPVRENRLCQLHLRSRHPTILLNLSLSGTSPFKYSYHVYANLRRCRFNILNLAAVRAERIYDLLGLYDRAALLITSDTATLHLAAASNIPYIAFINDGGSGSVPRGNCILSIRYSQVTQRTNQLVEALNGITDKVFGEKREMVYA